MSKSSRRFDNPNQLSIFELLKNVSEPVVRTKGSFAIIDSLRQALRDGIKRTSLSRHQIAGEMSHILGETITKEMIDSWTRESDENNGKNTRHIPAEYLPAFCKVTENHEAIRIMGRLVGLFVVQGPEAMRAEIQKLDEDIKGLQSAKKKRMLFLRELEG